MILLFYCGMGAAAVEAYIDSVPLPGDPLAPQASVLYYRDGQTIFARVGTTDHSDVPLSAVPLPVRQTILAAEDRGFYDHWGVSARGVFRAAVANVSGASQGASTITQQYARNAFLTLDFSVERKATEFALAVKLERRYSKDDIFARYLNTIYFGRGAYGIAAAAHAYFGVSTNQLTLAQGAVLAAVIKDPWRFDPTVDAEGAHDRWAWVLSSARSLGWLSEATVAGLEYPRVLPRSSETETLAGPNGLVVDQIERELNARGITSQALHTGGLSIVTTLDRVAQDSALRTVESTLGAQPNELHAALVAVDPSSGAVRAYYGGDRGRGFFDDAMAARPPASTFKPVVLAAAIRQGISYLSRWDGSSPRLFPDRDGVPLVNYKGRQCPDCTLEKAMVDSLNTPFYAVTEQIGAARVREMAINLGVSDRYGNEKSLVDVKGDPRPGQTRADIALGRYAVSPADLASVYATFAANGVRSTRYFVESASTSGGSTLWTARPERHRVLDEAVAADVSAVLRSVVDGHKATPGRPAAGKTGTQQYGNTHDNQDAWMAGYTPQLSTVVWLGRSVPGPIRDTAGNPIEGETIPTQLWRGFLQTSLDGESEVPFPTPAHLGRTDVGDAGRDNGQDTLTGSRTPAAPQGSQPVTRTAHEGKYLALTFDDGPSTHTPEILDLLAGQHVKATFCVTGDNVVRYPELVRRIVDEGHALCNHSTHHDDLGTASEEKIRDDIAATNAAIARVVPGATVTYFRAPFGDWGASSKVAAGLGHTPLGWNVDPNDWRQPGVTAIVSTVTTQLTPRAVVLMHDGGGDRQQTIDALKILLPQLRGQGWSFDLPEVTVRSHPQPNPDDTPSPSDGQAPPDRSASPSTSRSPSPSRTTKASTAPATTGER